jgi:hypothetical protein
MRKGQVEVDPRTVYFTHSKIRNTFTGCGKRLEETLDELLDKRITVYELPVIRVLTDGEKMYSQNNRRLWVFKQLAARGVLDTVPAVLEPLAPKELARFRKNTYSLTAKVGP